MPWTCEITPGRLSKLEARGEQKCTTAVVKRVGVFRGEEV